MPYTVNNGVHIYYEVIGTGPPVLLYHGLTGSHKHWHDNGFVESLKQDYTLILLDARGHGMSDKPHNHEDYTWEIRVKDVESVLDCLNIKKTHYIGYSSGGWVGFSMAKYASDRLYSLIIGGSHPYPDKDRVLRKIDGSDPDILIEALESISGQSFGRKIRESFADIDTVAIAAHLGRGFPDAIVPHLTMPCLFYAGEKDIRYNQIRDSVKELPDAQFVGVPGMGHHDIYIHGKRVIPYVKEFLKSLTKQLS